MSSNCGRNFKISIFGESHGKGIGVVIDGVPPGEKIDMDEIIKFMSRRSAKGKSGSTKRIEADEPIILSGIIGGYTCGTPIAAMIENTDTRSQDYPQAIARPGHADYTGFVRYNGYNDIRGGGHFSGRLTAPLVFAGAIAKQILSRKKIYISAHLYTVKDIHDTAFDERFLNKEYFERISEKPLAVIDDDIAQEIKALMEKTRMSGDSIGAIIECAVIGMPAGMGSPIFDGIENIVSSVMFGIPGVKGLEFGSGFHGTTLYGSENNDEFYISENGVNTKTNNHGGILGGISSGMPILFKVAMKPTPSISIEQKSINYVTNEEIKIKVKGRHDVCIAVRGVVCVEAAAAVAMMEIMGDKNGIG